MPRRSLIAFASILFALAQVPNAVAAQNIGNNWPSQSCGCSIAGKCYVKLNNDYQFECVPDGGASNACKGVCSLTNNPVDTTGGAIMRPKSSTSGSGGVLKK
jgi:hypothetical protein